MNNSSVHKNKRYLFINSFEWECCFYFSILCIENLIGDRMLKILYTYDKREYSSHKQEENCGKRSNKTQIKVPNIIKN